MTNQNTKVIDKITGVYKLIVYESGKIEVNQQPFDYIFDQLDFDVPIFHPSSRMQQVISVIEKVTDIILKDNIAHKLNNEYLSKFISKACYDVAGENNVTVQTITDKITRQLGLNKDQFTKLLLDFYTDVHRNNVDECKLKDTLLKYVSKNNKNDDYSFINHSLTEISKKINSI